MTVVRQSGSQLGDQMRSVNAMSYGGTAYFGRGYNIPRIDTAANWTAANPILDLYEMAFESDTGKCKIGDGATAWTSLSYFISNVSYNNALLPSGALYQAYDRYVASDTNATVLTSGTLVLCAINLPINTVVTSITFASGTTALAGGTNQWFGLFNSSRVALAFTSNDTSTAWGTNANKTLSLTAPFTTTYSGLHYVGIMVAAGTVPSLLAISSAAFTSNVGGVTPMVCGTSNTGQTTVPGLPFTASALTYSRLKPYFYVS